MPRTKSAGARGLVLGKGSTMQRQGTLLRCKILKRRDNDVVGEEYYVHYQHLNRRMDEWVKPERIFSKIKLSIADDTIRSGRRQTARQLRFTNDDSIENRRSIKYISCIQFGWFEIDTWYFSPYPDEYEKQRKLFVCEYCLKYMRLEKSYRIHLGNCQYHQPPGDEIYRKDTLAIYEIDGAKHKLYCQNLCLLAKLFIDHKTVLFCVDSFLFYVLCEVDYRGSHMMGYFSKQKDRSSGNNVSYMVTLPPFQRLGYGKMLISLSYELSKIEGVVETPERPLSDLGHLSYLSYWSWVLADIMSELEEGEVTVEKLSKMTSIEPSDIIFTLENMGLLEFRVGNDVACVTTKLIDRFINSPRYSVPRPMIDTAFLKWHPPNVSSGLKPRKSGRGRRSNAGPSKKKV